MAAADGATGIDVFYPIFPDSDWIERVVPLGIRTVQLRLKDADETELRRQIVHARDVCRAHSCQLIVNDYWQAALELSCDYIHLGQEDLAVADIQAIKRAGVRLGVSTHSEEELEIALSVSPDYVALGPIYDEAQSDEVVAAGARQIGRWKKRVGDVSLVAIGGITPDRAPGVLNAGADSVAVITDFITAPHPIERISQWLELVKTWRASHH